MLVSLSDGAGFVLICWLASDGYISEFQPGAAGVLGQRRISFEDSGMR